MNFLRKHILFLSILLMVSVIVLVSCRSILGDPPRKPKNEIPVTYNIGWWAYQKQMTLKNFNVEVVESKLNLFNSTSLVSYSLSGDITYKGYFKPYIRQVHISERKLETDSLQDISAVIEITPVVDVQNMKKQDSGIVSFNFKNEHLIQSMKWGTNKIRFVCGDFSDTLALFQKK